MICVHLIFMQAIHDVNEYGPMSSCVFVLLTGSMYILHDKNYNIRLYNTHFKQICWLLPFLWASSPFVINTTFKYLDLEPEAHRQEFSPGTPVSSPPSSVNGSANKTAKINAISTPSNLMSELSLHTTWHITRHVACDKGSVYCTWFAHDCAWATLAYVLEMVHGAARRL